MEEILQLLNDITSNDNDIRSDAENNLNLLQEESFSQLTLTFLQVFDNFHH